uniref:PDZ domain-containing protein n=1 Tax=Caenorhabditis japonica TaxID=281687 RepID=A0A8R1E4G2_CAEJA
MVAKENRDQIELGMVTFISEASFYNGLMLGDKIQKVNAETNFNNFEAEIMKTAKGGPAQIQLLRRNEAKPVTKPEQTRGLAWTPGHAMFNVTMQRPASMTTTSPGLRLFIKARSIIVTKVEEKTMSYGFLGLGDTVFAINSKPVPTKAADVEQYVRDSLAALSAGQKVEFFVVRAIGGPTAREMSKWIHLLCSEDVDTEMAADAIEIGREASNMHSIVLRKLITPSILSSDVKKTKKQINRTSDACESSITISTASTEMKINSDVSESEELKPVTSKSHAVSAQNMDVGAFDDE